MEFSAHIKGHEQEIIDLFTATFGASEGAKEGVLIGDLVRNLLSATPDQRLAVGLQETMEEPSLKVYF